MILQEVKMAPHSHWVAVIQRRLSLPACYSGWERKGWHLRTGPDQRPDQFMKLVFEGEYSTHYSALWVYIYINVFCVFTSVMIQDVTEIPTILLMIQVKHSHTIPAGYNGWRINVWYHRIGPGQLLAHNKGVMWDSISKGLPQESQTSGMYYASACTHGNRTVS